MRLGGLFHLCTDTTGARVALLDLSPELLAVAKKRVAGLGLAEHVDCIVLDVTDAKALANRGLLGSAACVTCSYCATMIPDWRGAFSAMLTMLAPEGYIGVIDFTQRFDRADDLAERLYKKWFSLDGVYFDRKHVDYLAEHTEPHFYTEGRSRTPYTPLYPSHYVYVGKKKQ